jgi:acyl-CoA thioesterase I
MQESRFEPPQVATEAHKRVYNRRYGVSCLFRQGFLALVPLVCGILLFSAIALEAAAARTVRLVALGDSLSAGYNLPADQAFPAVLEKALRARGHDIVIVNAGVSGDTSAGGRDRLDWSVPDGTDGVILELGANDALRGFSPDVTRGNLDAMIIRLKERGIGVLLAGMRAPPNMGDAYAKAFDGLYPELAAKHGIALYPFFLDGVAGQPALNQRDGIHPTAQGVGVIVERIVPSVETFLVALKARSG